MTGDTRTPIGDCCGDVCEDSGEVCVESGDVLRELEDCVGEGVRDKSCMGVVGAERGCVVLDDPPGDMAAKVEEEDELEQGDDTSGESVEEMEEGAGVGESRLITGGLTHPVDW